MAQARLHWSVPQIHIEAGSGARALPPKFKEFAPVSVGHQGASDCALRRSGPQESGRPTHKVALPPAQLNDDV